MSKNRKESAAAMGGLVCFGILGFLLFGSVSCQNSERIEKKDSLRGSPSSVVDGLKLSFNEVRVDGDTIQGELVGENVGIAPIAYAIYEDRPVFHIKRRESENVSKPQPLRPNASKAWGIEDEYGGLDPGESISGRFFIRGIVDHVWVGLRVRKDFSGEVVLWAGPFSRAEIECFDTRL